MSGRRFPLGAALYSDAPDPRPPSAMDKYAEAVGEQLARSMPPGGRFVVLLYEDGAPDIASTTNARSPEQLLTIMGRAFLGLEEIAKQVPTEPPS